MFKTPVREKASTHKVRLAGGVYVPLSTSFISNLSILATIIVKNW